MTDSNGVKPSNEELQALSDALDNPGVPLQFWESETAKLLICAELQRRQQPETEAASVPAELVNDLAQFIRVIDGSNTLGAAMLAEKITDWFSAYGRGQSQEPPTC